MAKNNPANLLSTVAKLCREGFDFSRLLLPADFNHIRCGQMSLLFALPANGLLGRGENHSRDNALFLTPDTDQTDMKSKGTASGTVSSAGKFDIQNNALVTKNCVYLIENSLSKAVM